jgi:hypothetical protein
VRQDALREPALAGDELDASRDGERRVRVVDDPVVQRGRADGRGDAAASGGRPARVDGDATSGRDARPRADGRERGG